MAPRLHQALEVLRELPHVGDVRGRGLLAGGESWRIRGLRTPFPRGVRFAERVADAALDAGLTVWPNVGQADGTNGDLVLLAPPFIIESWEIEDLAGRLSRAIRRVVAALPAANRSAVVSA